MRCEDVLNRLNARADGELRADDAAALDAHLAECAQCRADVEGLQAIDAELRRAFVPRREAAARLADSAAAAVRAAAAAPIAPPVAAPHVAWGQTLMAAAAGFLLALALFRPWQPRGLAPATSPAFAAIGRLAVASGPVEMRPISQLELYTCPEGSPIGPDSVVRTGPTAQCEISLDDGNSLRLDRNTEVTLHESDVVEVNRGRLWSCSRPGCKGVEIQSGGGTFMPQAEAQLNLQCQPEGVRLTVVEGEVNVQSGGESMAVGPGQQVRIAGGKLDAFAERCDPFLETAWVNSVVALRSSEHAELLERVNRLLANVGAAKLSLLYEDELRRLGDDGVPPLLAYLDATRGTPNVPQRATAARIVADVAQPRWIADLIELLTDANADVRFQAARGLERLTGRDQGCDARAWQSEPWDACAGAHEKWRAWWTANRDRYPAGRRDIPAPTSPPF